jgi:hypothetical protein
MAPAESLAQALQDPFAGWPATHVSEWFRYVARQFPLWTWDPHAYARLPEQKLGSTHPLQSWPGSFCLEERLT